jgi:methylamine dehydrogenase accessory protein MauD
METTLAISNTILWILVLILAAMVFALVRQIGILYERIAPAGALMTGSGLKTGEKIPVFDLETLDGTKIRIGGKNSTGKCMLLFFLSPRCPVCNTLIPILAAMQKSELSWLDIVFASDGDETKHRKWLEETTAKLTQRGSSPTGNLPHQAHQNHRSDSNLRTRPCIAATGSL